MRNVFAFKGAVPSTVAKNFEEVLYDKIFNDTSSSQISIQELFNFAIANSVDDIYLYCSTAFNYPDIKLND